ncbi:hypothetical protein ACFONG_12520 [Uliginosibacterium paludis]|uniref:Permease n=1 Tax=Uliginosibacterium paludis TaxID=1615952 RepID=A0ABV2CRI8_9RHOO
MKALRLPALLLLLTLTGCAGLQAQRSATPPPLISLPPTPAEPDYLALAGRYRTLSAAEQAAELEVLGKAYAAHRTEINRLQLALMLALAAPPAGDRSRAIALLDVAPGESTGRGRLHPLAQLLLPLLHELRRADENQSATQQKLREQQQAAEAMKQKLDALREIELRIQERPKNP